MSGPLDQLWNPLDEDNDGGVTFDSNSSMSGATVDGGYLIGAGDTSDTSFLRRVNLQSCLVHVIQ